MPTMSKEDTLFQEPAWPSACRRIVFIGSQFPTIGGGYTAAANVSTALLERGVQVRHVSIRPSVMTPEFPTQVVFPRYDRVNRPAVRGQRGTMARLTGLPFVLVNRLDRLICRRRFRRMLSGCSSAAARLPT